MQIRTSLGFRIVSIKVVTIKKTTDNKDKDMGKQKFLFLVVRVQTNATTVEMSMSVSQDTKTRSATWLKHISAGRVTEGFTRPCSLLLYAQ